MIKIEHVETWGFEHAIRGMRNPKDSWERSDSLFLGDLVMVGENDLELMRKLYKGGAEHRKYLRQIFVSMDIVAPLYWWKEMDQYRINVTTNSTSTMHTIHAKPIEWDDFSREHLLQVSMDALGETIRAMNMYRNEYLKTNNKQYWWQMIQLLPSSYNQLRTITMNYENVINIIHQRKSHKLDEWVDFVEVLQDLPYIREITGNGNV